MKQQHEVGTEDSAIASLRETARIAPALRDLSGKHEVPGSDEGGLILEIQKYSLHDGPGVRDVVFMKGCPLRCAWCANPETQEYNAEVAYIESRCIGCTECGLCKAACEVGAIRESANGKIAICRDACTRCGKCAALCPSNAICLLGKYMSLDEVMKEAEADDGFYSRSGGGITVSGGEPLSQMRFVVRLLRKCLDRGMDTAVETCGHGLWEDIQGICRNTRLVFYDIKTMDARKHQAFTGKSNETILKNIKRISDRIPGLEIIARTPIVPGFNDSEGEVEGIAAFLSGIPSVTGYELLPYHGLGESKYRQIGRSYLLAGARPPRKERMELLRKAARRRFSHGWVR